MGQTKSSKSKRSAVPVSYRLQLAGVLAFVATVLAQFVFIVPSFFTAPGGPLFPGLLSMVGYNLFPIVVFAIFFLFSGRYPLAISRWFIAVVKTVTILAVFGVLQSLRSLVMMYAYRPSDGVPMQGPPPAWVTSPLIDMGFMGLCVIAAITVALLLKKKKI